MRYLVTGTTSGIGKAIKERLQGDIFELNRSTVDLNVPEKVINYNLPLVDCAILNAGHDLGGGVPFTQHHTDDILKVLNCNLVSNVLLAQKLLHDNKQVEIIFITSTNVNRQYPNNLAYNVSKLGMKNLLDLIRIDYPEAKIKEARIGLTKTQFNANRHKQNHKPINDLYASKHLTAQEVAAGVISLIGSETSLKEMYAE